MTRLVNLIITVALEELEQVPNIDDMVVCVPVRRRA